MSAPTIYVANALSLSMLSRTDQAGTPCGYQPNPGDPVGPCARIPRPVAGLAAAMEILADAEATGTEIVSAVGHPDTAEILSDYLDREIECARISVRLERTDQRALIAQVVRADGTPYRLPEGATTLPDDAAIEWWLI